MSDTILVMRWVAALVVVGACASDPTLQVIVKHDPAYTSLIDHTVVSVYETPDLTCQQIEFGDVDTDKLAGALVSDAANGEALSGLSRTGTKIIVARGFAKTGALVTIQCASKGEIQGNDSITINTVPAATLTIANLNDGSRDGLVITTSDARNELIANRQVYWRVYGAAGTSADPATYTNVSDGVWEPKQAACTTGGDAKIYPFPPKLPGGYAQRLRVSWADMPLPLISSFTPVDGSKLLVASGTSVVVQPCAVQRKNNVSTIVCIDTPARNQQSTVTTFAYTVGAPGTLVSTGTTTLTPAVLDEYIGVVAIDGAAGVRDVYAISTKGAWKALNAAPMEVLGSTWCVPGLASNFPCSGLFAVAQLQVVPACGTKPAYLLARTNEDPKLRMLPLRGGTMPTELVTRDGEINNAGCVTELQSDGSAAKLRQVVVLNTAIIVGTSTTPTKVTQAVFDCSATSTPCTVQLPNGGGVGFYPGTEAELIGSTFDATGSTLDHWVMIPAGAKDRLVTRSRQLSAAPPRQLITAELDTDKQPDLLWAFGSRTEVDIQVAYARQAEGAPLSALTPLSSGNNPQPQSMFAADFNNDGYDEIVIVVGAGLAAGQSTTLVVVPTGIKYKEQFTDYPDDHCP
jgi:hypothetical protein